MDSGTAFLSLIYKFEAMLVVKEVKNLEVKNNFDSKKFIY